MKKVEISSLTWTAEDFDDCAEQLFDCDGITESTRDQLINMSEDEKIGFLESTIRHSEDWLIEKIHETIYNDMFDTFGDN